MADFVCVELPELPPLDFKVPFLGAQLSGFADFSLALPNNCSVSFNLLAQLSAALGSVDCLIKVFNAIVAIPDAIAFQPDKLANAILDLQECIRAAAPGIGFAFTVQGILRVVVNVLGCLTKELDSIVNFNASIDLSVAEGNPKLESILICARDNANASGQALLRSLSPLQPFLTVAAGLSGGKFSPPDLSSLSTETDLNVAIEGINGIIDALEPLAAA